MFKCERCNAELARTDGVSLFFGTGGISMNYIPVECLKCSEELKQRVTTTWYRLEKQKSFDKQREKV